MRLALLLTLLLGGSVGAGDMDAQAALALATARRNAKSHEVPPAPKQSPKLEYRLIGGQLYLVPSDSSWTVPSTPPLSCPDGRCQSPLR